jgi:hypothetical protein
MQKAEKPVEANNPSRDEQATPTERHSHENTIACPRNDLCDSVE